VADREKVEQHVADLRKALDSDNTEDIKKEVEALTDAVYSITTKLYQKAQAEKAGGEGEAPGGGGAPPEDDTVVDADFKVKDE
jgi:hypothetical protein